MPLTIPLLVDAARAISCRCSSTGTPDRTVHRVRATHACEHRCAMKAHPSTRRTVGVLVAGVLAAFVAAACQSTTVPAGAQVVHVVATDQSITLTPNSVRAGEVYLVLDGPSTSILFVQSQTSAEATPGPLDDESLSRLRKGDTFHTAVIGLDAGGCSQGQDAENRGRMGPCGNVMQVVLSPGNYAVVAGELEAGGATAPRIGVLTVVP